MPLPPKIDVANADGIYREIAAEFARGAQVVIADMTGTVFCDTVGTCMLMLASRHTAAIGTELRLVAPAPWVIEAWKHLGVDAVLPTYDSLEEAMAGVDR